jgi:hypothetical protein
MSSLRRRILCRFAGHTLPALRPDRANIRKNIVVKRFALRVADDFRPVRRGNGIPLAIELAFDHVHPNTWDARLGMGLLAGVWTQEAREAISKLEFAGKRFS